MAQKQVLVVEDEPKIARVVQDYLENAGYGVKVLAHGNEVVAQVRKAHPDLIVLDIMIPGKDGMEICREIRKFSNVPIIMLTARVDEIDRVLGLELGADDYICKPFSPREVVARVKAVLRRGRSEPASGQISLGSITVDLIRHQVKILGHEIDLTPSEFALLRTFISHPERVFSRSELIERVQGYAFEGYDRTIDSHIKNLRKKVDAAFPGQRIINTVYGVGYRLDPPDASEG